MRLGHFGQVYTERRYRGIVEKAARIKEDDREKTISGGYMAS